MRMSCNGCRVLRKGCSESCSIRACLQWMKTPESQANATLFLAKFYGRAALINLINAAPHPLRPAIFRSLLYEASGRIVNPVYGSTGLLWSGSWHLCQAAVEAVLAGAPITQVSDAGSASPPLKACDIRHVSRDDASERRAVKARSRSKRKPKLEEHAAAAAAAEFFPEGAERDGVSVETVEAAVVVKGEEGKEDVELGLRLGFEPVHKLRKVGPVVDGSRFASCKVEMGLDMGCPALVESVGGWVGGWVLFVNQF